LRNEAGEAFMKQYHPLADLAPRDIVSRAEFTEMQKVGSDHCWLDFSPIDPERLKRNFPTILERLEAHGIKVPEQMAPVRPVAHYTMGGIYTDLHARATLRRLYAVGECTCTGVHGANRLASNSLLEGLVFGSRAAEAASTEKELPPSEMDELRSLAPTPLPRAPAELADRIRALMWDKVGIVRHAEGLQEACQALGDLVSQSSEAASPEGAAEEAETANMALIAYLTALAALRRLESRGGHYRTDHPQMRDEWRYHQRVKLGPDGQPVFVLRQVVQSGTESGAEV
ncbi:MAG: FAD-binding protein, partial [Armatimonadetes bacterium]|nr:FAD-binding protein [Armatimonadota bacterium]